MSQFKDIFKASSEQIRRSHNVSFFLLSSFISSRKSPQLFGSSRRRTRSYRSKRNVMQIPCFYQIALAGINIQTTYRYRERFLS
ncbi:hypothetical protein PUN28_014866 [Cardiocondyla obscurior]|uniref:Uncharacterized protein n=1 Tax=Cardiocondyla obscurior TaxID=286306 RepID=A0AAW2EVW2_9HYME